MELYQEVKVYNYKNKQMLDIIRLNMRGGQHNLSYF